MRELVRRRFFFVGGVRWYPVEQVLAGVFNLRIVVSRENVR